MLISGEDSPCEMFYLSQYRNEMCGSGDLKLAMGDSKSGASVVRFHLTGGIKSSSDGMAA